jgi:hypothetical protein
MYFFEMIIKKNKNAINREHVTELGDVYCVKIKSWYLLRVI